jgi:hypothetical protein
MKIEGHAGIQFWLNRVAEEEYEEAEKLLKDAQTKNWQAINYKSMPEISQTIVIAELGKTMVDMGWSNEFNELLRSDSDA